MVKPKLDHVALLVDSIESVCSAWSLNIENQIDQFDDIGTKELYVGGADNSQRLLLMQAIGPGPYRDAYKKRGPGLHHVGINVPDLSAFLSTVETSGWLLHPKSLRYYKSMNQVYLCRPDVPVLIELGEGKASHRPSYVEQLTLPVPTRCRRLFEIFDGDSIAFSDSETSVSIGGRKYRVDQLGEIDGQSDKGK